MSCCSKPKNNEPSHGGCCAPKKEPSHGGCCAPKNEGCCASKTKIDRQMTIEDILGMFPYKAQKLSQELSNAGLHCVGCHAAVWETLEGGMLSHGKTDAQIDDLVTKLNALLEQENDLSTIILTARAAAKFMEILEDEGKEGWGMRFSEELAGCNGFEYVLDFSEKSDADDQTFLSHGIEVHVKKAMVPRLLGSEIDFVDGLRGAGFKVTNPNVRSSCGCGSSHNY